MKTAMRFWFSILLCLLPALANGQVALSAITQTNVLSGADKVLLHSAGAARLATVERLSQSGEIVTPPPGINPPFLVYRQPGPRYSSSVDHEHYNAARTVTRYVLATGSDLADGASWATAKRTVTNAFQSAGTNSCAVYVGPGSFTGSNYSVTVNATLICTGGVAVVDRLLWYRCEAYVRNISFRGGSQTLGGPYPAYSNNFVAVECAFNSSPVDNGLQIFQNAGLTYLLRCEARSNFMDGFSYKAWSTGPTTAWNLEQDCIAFDNGTADADNGSTRHDNFSGVRLNGEYRYNYGRNVHDIVAGVGGGTASQSWNLNCVAGGSRTGSFDVAFSNPDEVEMVLWDCTASGDSVLLEYPAWAVAIRPRRSP